MRTQATAKLDQQPAGNLDNPAEAASYWLMARNNYSDEQLRLAARLHYVDGLGQTEVARFFKVSQAKVSRLLAIAKERGIVRVSVAEYEPRDLILERAVRKKFGLESVTVIKTIAGADGEDSRRTVGHFGGPFVEGLLPANSVVAIAGGRSIRELVQHVPEDKNRNLTVIQAMGSIDSTVGSEDALELGRILARRSGGSFLTLNTPAFVPDRKTRDAFLSLPQINSVRQRLAEADVALVGVGTLDNSAFAARGVLSHQEMEELTGCGAVGEICGRFYDKNGRECDSRWRDRVVSIDLDQLRKIPQVVGIVAGGDRSAAIAAAVRGNLLKALIIDDNAGRFLAGLKPAPAKGT